jgi:integrase
VYTGEYTQKRELPVGRLNKLTAIAITKKTKPGAYSDGGGLYLRVESNGVKGWFFRYKRNGRSRKMGLGPTHAVTLAQARDRASECRSVLFDGRDPIDERRSQRERAERAHSVTFRHSAEALMKSHGAGWKNEKHRRQWQSTLETYAYPVFGGLPVSTVDVALVLRVLEPIWHDKTETATRLRGRIEQVLDWAKVRGYRHGENPARWRGHLDKLLPARSKIRKVKHHAAMPYSEIPVLMAELRSNESISARALEFTILTAVRSSELLNARWPEFDLTNRMWVVPAERMKAGRGHRVPLCDRAVEILKSTLTTDGFVFPGARAGNPLSDMAMLQLLRGLRGEGLTVHGFRSSFRDWGAERTSFANELLEMALAHVVSDKVEAAYRRGDMFEKRRRLMDDWAQYCQRPLSLASEVLVMHPALRSSREA